MLVLKFIQGLALVGVLGGAANPVYYRRVLNYVQLKYHKRYLYQKKERWHHERMDSAPGRGGGADAGGIL